MLSIDSSDTAHDGPSLEGLEKRRLSSKLTLLCRGIGWLWLGLAILGVTTTTPLKSFAEVKYVVGAAIILTVAGLVCWPEISLKTVVLEGETLTIKGYWRTCTVQCKEIVSLHTFWPIQLRLIVTCVPIVTFKVSRRTPLGRTFRFLARVTLEGSGSKHPDVRLLQELAGMEKSKSAPSGADTTAPG